jgi:hypothetical protein
MTEWRPVPSYPGLEASDDGQVRRGTKILRQHTQDGGYFYVSYGQRSLMVNRLVCEAFNGPPPTPFHQAAHDNGARTDNVPSNLIWKTRKENYQDQIRHGTSKRGEGHHLAKLTEEQVREIRRRAGTVTGRSMALEFGMQESTVSLILNRRLWPHLE